jgi:hypothetical protein
LIWVAFSVPVAVLGYFATADMSKAFIAILDPISRGQKPPSSQAIIDALNAAPMYKGLGPLYIAVALLGAPLAGGALLAGASRAYLDGIAPTFAHAYSTALRLWPRLLGILLIFVALGGLAYIAVILALIPFIFFAGLVAAVQPVLGAIVGIVLGIAFFLVVVGGAILTGLAYQTACFTEVVEHPGFIRSVTMGFKRVFGASRRRSLLTGLALFACYVGFALLTFGAQALSLALLRSEAVSIALSVIIGLLIQVYLTEVTCLYYFDLRVRSEGLDLQLAIAPAAEPTA